MATRSLKAWGMFSLWRFICAAQNSICEFVSLSYLTCENGATSVNCQLCKQVSRTLTSSAGSTKGNCLAQPWPLTQKIIKAERDGNQFVEDVGWTPHVQQKGMKDMV